LRKNSGKKEISGYGEGNYFLGVETGNTGDSNACTRARMALALGKLTTGTPKFRGSGSLSACTIDKR
jgi:hypothetical protein